MRQAADRQERTQTERAHEARKDQLAAATEVARRRALADAVATDSDLRAGGVWSPSSQAPLGPTRSQDNNDVRAAPCVRRYAKQASSGGAWIVAGIGLLVLSSWPVRATASGAANNSSPICAGGVPCVVEKGSVSFDNSEYVTTAAGCSQTVKVKFGSALDRTSSPTVHMCERTAGGTCVQKSGVILSPFQRDCCSTPFVKRDRRCIAPSMADDPNGVFQCIQLSYTMEAGYSTAHVTVFSPYGADLVNNGQIEACLVASHGEGTLESEPYCVLLVVRRCSVCLQKGEGLASVAKRYGSHWTQVYSANPDIKGNPDDLEVGQLVRLGNQYSVKDGDTLVALALKFGVSVNQIFFWNPHLAPLSDLGGKGEKDYLSRLLPIGHQLCILPKTCLNTFGPQQPIYDLGEAYEPGHGGWWSDPPQVVPTVLQLDDVNYGPGGGLDL